MHSSFTIEHARTNKSQGHLEPVKVIAPYTPILHFAPHASLVASFDDAYPIINRRHRHHRTNTYGFSFQIAPTKPFVVPLDYKKKLEERMQKLT